MTELTLKEINDAKQAISSYIFSTTNISGRYVIFLAIAGLFIDQWDFNAFSLSAFTFVNTFHPTPAFLGLSVAAVNIGGAVGAYSGGFLTDRLGRRIMFLVNMALFGGMALLSAFSTDLAQFFVFRTLLGFALGADIATGFSYMFEFLGKKQRDNYYSAWGYVVSGMFLVAAAVTFVLLLLIGPSVFLWRIILVLGGILALIVLALRTKIPESPLWHAYRGNFRKAKEVIKKVYGADLNDVPDIDVSEKTKVRVKDYFNVFRIGVNRQFAFTQALNVLETFVFWGFAFYLALTLSTLHLGSETDVIGYLSVVWGTGFVVSMVTPFILKRAGVKILTRYASYGMAAVLFMIYLTYVKTLPTIAIVPLSTALIALLFLGTNNYINVLNYGIPSFYRGILNGWNYGISKIIAAGIGLATPIIIASVGNSGQILFLLAIALACSFFITLLGSDVRRLDPTDIDKTAIKARV